MCRRVVLVDIGRERSVSGHLQSSVLGELAFILAMGARDEAEMLAVWHKLCGKLPSCTIEGVVDQVKTAIIEVREGL